MNTSVQPACERSTTSDPAVRSTVLLAGLRDKAETSLHHWQRILEDAEQFRGAKAIANSKEQIVWLRGYLRAMDDIQQANTELRHGAKTTEHEH